MSADAALLHKADLCFNFYPVDFIDILGGMMNNMCRQVAFV